MPVTLSKGQKVTLEKKADTRPNRIIMGLGWEARDPGFWRRFFGSIEELDLDASCLMLNEEGQLVDVVWFKQLYSKDGSVAHTGDNRTGGGKGDDEQIYVDFDKMPPTVHHLYFIVSCFTGQTFSHIDSAYCRLIDVRTKEEVARYELGGATRFTSYIMARISRENDDWRLQAVGEGVKGYTPEQVMPSIRRLLREAQQELG